MYHYALEGAVHQAQDRHAARKSKKAFDVAKAIRDFDRELEAPPEAAKPTVDLRMFRGVPGFETVGGE